MSEKEKWEIAEMVKTAAELAENDPQGFAIAKANVDILKARANLAKAYRCDADGREDYRRGTKWQKVSTQ